MTKEKDQQQALENLKALEEAKLISRRDFFTLSSQLSSAAVLLTFLTPDRALAWVATRMRKGRASNSTNIDVGDIANSLRLRSSVGAYLYRVPASAGNLQLWTYSTWVKRGVLTSFYPSFMGNVANGVGDNFSAYFGTDDTIIVTVHNTLVALKTTAAYRDTSGWYHIVLVWDTNNATAANRCRLYVNGAEVTAFTTDNRASMSGIGSSWNKALGHYLYGSSNTQLRLDGYVSRTCFVDGQALAPSSFGYLNSSTNSWVTKSQSTVKAVVDAGGTNSFMLDFDNGTSLATLGYDKSSKGNNWTLNNVTLTAGVNYDWTTDTPTNNFCNLNPLDQSSTAISNGNLLNVLSNTGNVTCSTTIGMTSGKFYVEFTYGANTSSAVCFGVVPADSFNAGLFVLGVGYYGISGNKYVNGAVTGYGATFTTGDVIGLCLNVDSGTITFYKNNVSQGAITLPTSSSGWRFAVSNGTSGGSQTVWFNAGQLPFNYTPPAGYKSLCTKNLSTPTIANAKKHFDITLHSGSASSVTTTGLLFQPDLNWTKKRSGAAADSAVVLDIVRGFNNRIFTALTSVENTANTVTVNSDGVTYLNGFGVTNEGAGYTYVDWLWKGGGAAVANSQGSITSQVSANPTAGFSIVSYTGTGANATVGHGLGVAPKMIILKKRADAAASWNVYHNDIGNQYYLNLELTVAKQGPDATRWNNTSPTSTVFSLGSVNATNGTGAIIAYCFAEIAGFSKISSYTGNGSTDGAFVFCGFRPKWVMVKDSSSGGGQWFMVDAGRDPNNVVTSQLNANASAAESIGSYVDFISSGFKFRGTGTNYNASGVIYIFIAFAEAPFKYANAR